MVPTSGDDIVAIGTGGGTLRLLHPSTGAMGKEASAIRPVKLLTSAVIDGRSLLAVADLDDEISLWDATALQQQTKVRVGDRLLLDMALVGGCPFVAVASIDSQDHTVSIWDLDEGRHVIDIPLPGTPVAVTSARLGEIVVGMDVGLLAIRLDLPVGPGGR
jgi:hypothetical protein